MKHFTPAGVQEWLPDDAVRHTMMTRSVTDVFESGGFSPIRTPVVEYFDALSPGLDPNLISRSIRFFDSSGHLMILRPDHTTPIARLVANRMTDRDYVKVYYVAPVFRTPSDSEQMELFQAGVEWIGSTSPATDAELIQLCCTVLNELGFTDLGIDIGHPDFSRSMTADQRRSLIRHDYVSLGFIPDRGGIDVASHIPDLVALDTALRALGLTVAVNYNSGMISEFNYYTGAHFEIYVPGIRQVVASGGRYDHLMAKFGHNSPAVGFAINLNSIQESLAKC